MTHRPIAIFYHCLLFLGSPAKTLPIAPWIVQEQMDQLEDTGLLAAAQEFHVGVNGGAESEKAVAELIPTKAKVTYHGLDCRNENLTILMLEEWVKTHPGWNILYFHAKGSSKSNHRQGWNAGHTLAQWHDVRSGFQLAKVRGRPRIGL